MYLFFVAPWNACKYLLVDVWRLCVDIVFLTLLYLHKAGEGGML